MPLLIECPDLLDKDTAQDMYLVQVGRNHPLVKLSLSPPLPLTGGETGGKLLPTCTSQGDRLT